MARHGGKPSGPGVPARRPKHQANGAEEIESGTPRPPARSPENSVHISLTRLLSWPLPSSPTAVQITVGIEQRSGNSWTRCWLQPERIASHSTGLIRHAPKSQALTTPLAGEAGIDGSRFTDQTGMQTPLLCVQTAPHSEQRCPVR